MLTRKELMRRINALAHRRTQAAYRAERAALVDTLRRVANTSGDVEAQLGALEVAHKRQEIEELRHQYVTRRRARAEPAE